MTRSEILDFAKSLGLAILSEEVRDERLMFTEVIYHFYYVPARQYPVRHELIADLRVDDHMNIVDYNNALAICMNTLKQFQSWS